MDWRRLLLRLGDLQGPGLHQRFRYSHYRLLPGLCTLCRAPSLRALDLCRSCEADLPWIATGCVTCALPLEHASLCGTCLTAPPVFDSCRSAFAYQEPVASMIRRFKHHHSFRDGWLLGELFSRYLQQHLSDGNRPDIIVPVPSHWRRRWQRGYNQTELLARHLSQRLAIPLRHRLLRVNRHHPSQQGLGRADRRANLHGSFTVTADRAIDGLHIALLDDVMTTGATADELAQLLKHRGAMEVEVWCLARTPDHQGRPQVAGKKPSQHR